MAIVWIAVSLATSSSWASTNIIITPILLPAQNSPTWQTLADKVIADALAGKITTNTMATPTNYALGNYSLSWSNLVYATNDLVWLTNNFVQWLLVDARDTSGADNIALDMLTVSHTSSDGGILNGTLGFTGLGYTARAPLIRSDGTMVTNAPASTKGKRVLVLAFLPLFNGGDTQAGRDQVMNWVNSHQPYSVSFSAQVIGEPTSLASATTSTAGNHIPAPTLVIDGSGISVDQASPGVIYQIEVRAGLRSTNSWTSWATITGTNRYPLASLPSGNGFIRLKVP